MSYSFSSGTVTHAIAWPSLPCGSPLHFRHTATNKEKPVRRASLDGEYGLFHMGHVKHSSQNEVGIVSAYKGFSN